MADDLVNIVLEHLRALRSDTARVEGKMDAMSEKIGDLETGQMALQGVIMALGHYMHVIDHRVEAIEAKIGGGA